MLYTISSNPSKTKILWIYDVSQRDDAIGGGGSFIIISTKNEFSAKSPTIQDWGHYDFWLFPQIQCILQEWRLTIDDMQRNATSPLRLFPKTNPNQKHGQG